MPVLPKIDTAQSIFSTGQLGSQNSQATPADLGGVTAQALGGLAQAGERAGDQTVQTALMYKAINDETRSNDVYANSFSPDVEALQSKLHGLQGRNAVEQGPQVMQAVRDAQAKYRAGLTDPQQRLMYDRVSTQRTERTLLGMQDYIDNQNKVYQQQVSDGMVNSFQRQAAGVWNDPNAFNGALQSIVIERQTHAGTSGQPVEFTNAKIQRDISSSWIDRLRGIAASGDASTALTLLKNGENWTDGAGNARHTDVRSQIEPNNLAALQNELNSHAADQIGVHYGMVATSPAPAVGSPLQNVVQTIESRGKDTNADGTPVVSAKGAKYAMQVMPATAANPGFGIKPAASDTPEEYNRVGTQLLSALSQKYSGDNGKTMAAYNAGSGAVDAAVKQYGNDWLAHMPAETQGYVNRGTALLAKQPVPAGGAAGAVSGTLPVGNAAGVPNAAQIAPQPAGLAQDPEVMRANQETAAEQARQQAEAHVLQMTGNADAAKRAGQVAASTVVGNTNAAIAAQHARQQVASGALSKAIAGDPVNGAAPITSFAELVANPVAYANYRQLSPAGQAAVTERLTNPGTLKMTQESLNRYYQLRGQAANDPEAFMKVDLSQEFGKIPEGPLMQLITQQTTAAKRDVSQEAKNLSWSRAKSDVDDMLTPLGLGSAVKKTDEANLAKNEQFYGRLQDALETYHEQNKKYPDTVTTRKIAASLLVQGTQGQDHWWEFNNKISAFESKDISKFQAAIPDEQKPQLTMAFQKVMGHAPTDEELTQWYTRFKLSQKGK